MPIRPGATGQPATGKSRYGGNGVRGCRSVVLQVGIEASQLALAFALRVPKVDRFFALPRSSVVRRLRDVGPGGLLTVQLVLPLLLLDTQFLARRRVLRASRRRLRSALLLQHAQSQRFLLLLTL